MCHEHVLHCCVIMDTLIVALYWVEAKKWAGWDRKGKSVIGNVSNDIKLFQQSIKAIHEHLCDQFPPWQSKGRAMHVHVCVHMSEDIIWKCFCCSEVYIEDDSPVTSEVWSWSPSGPLIPARGCAASGTGAPRLSGPVPGRTRPPRATRPGGSGAGPCSLSTTARIVSTPPYRLRRRSSQTNRVHELVHRELKAAVHGAPASTTVGPSLRRMSWSFTITSISGNFTTQKC